VGQKFSPENKFNEGKFLIKRLWTELSFNSACFVGLSFVGELARLGYVAFYCVVGSLGSSVLSLAGLVLLLRAL